MSAVFGILVRARSRVADESSPLAVDASPGVAAGARAYVELESTAFGVPEIDCVAMRYGYLRKVAFSGQIALFRVARRSDAMRPGQ
jgi:hypothetical protein